MQSCRGEKAHVMFGPVLSEILLVVFTDYAVAFSMQLRSGKADWGILRAPV